MAKKTVLLMPQTRQILETMGTQIKRARLRRRISADLVAKRSGVSRATVSAIEKGSPSVSIGMYAAVLSALQGLDKDLLLVAKDDELGRTLEALSVPERKRAPKRREVGI